MQDFLRILYHAIAQKSRYGAEFVIQFAEFVIQFGNMKSIVNFGAENQKIIMNIF